MTLPLTTGRRAALAIGVPLSLLLIADMGLNLVSSVGRGEIPVSYSIPVSAGRVSVSASGGDVRVQQAAAAGGQARLAGTAYYSLIRPHITEHTAAGAASFALDCVFPVGNCGLNATVSVPEHAAVSVSTGGGDVTAAGTDSAVTVTTGGGDVSVNGASGDLSLSTDGGNINATAVTAPRVAAASGGGDIEIDFTQVPRNVRIRTDGGNITIVVPAGAVQYHVSASTDGGNVSKSVPESTTSPNVITATSGGGDITIRQAS